MKRYLYFLLTALALFAQQQVVSQFVTLMDYSGTNLIYTGKAATPTVYTTTYRVAGCTGAAAHCMAMTNIIDSSNTSTVTATAHGLAVGNEVCVTGGTDTDLNACYYVQTVADANTYTITTSAVTDATYTTGIVVTTRAPLNVDPIWFIQLITYDGSGNLIRTQTSAPNSIWINRAVTTGSTKTLYR